MRQTRLPTERASLLVLLGIVSVAFGWILLPFYGAILWGAIIAMLFFPAHRHILGWMPNQRNAAAALTLLLVVVMVILPLVYLAVMVARESAYAYQQLESGKWNASVYLHGRFDALPGWIGTWLDRFGLSNFSALQAKLTAALAKGANFIASQLLSVGQNTFEFFATLFITLYLAFFLLRDGDAVWRAIRRALSLASEDKIELLGEFSTVIRATVRGSLLVATAQGLLGGLAFWFLGVSGALLWAAMMAFVSLVPVLGAGLVWMPVAIYFLLSGSVWQGVALIAWGVLVIGLVDNLLRPILVGQRTGLPDYVVLVSTLGGIVVYGINGFVIGPAIAAMFLATWNIYARSNNTDMSR